MPSQHKRRLLNQINIVPYVDVMLVLLVIFMVTAPLVTPGVVELPSLGKSSQAPALPLEVVVRSDASLMLRDRTAGKGAPQERNLSSQQLVAAIRERQGSNADIPVVIAADKDVKYEAVMKVMDDLQRAQVRRVGLLVKPAGP
jgi:biopolymer transport protein TolR